MTLPSTQFSQDTVLVAGGAGYIGSHIVAALRRADRPVVVLDNLSTGHRWAVPAGVPLIMADIADAQAVCDTVARFGVGVAIHCAALIQVGESMRAPGRYWRANVGKTLAFTEALLRAGCSTLVFSSTAAVYGEPVYVPLDESHPLAPNNVYGRTKLAVEQMLDDCSRASELRFAALRYFNAAGACASGEIGEAHPDESHLIPLVMRAALEQGPPLVIFGDDWDTADGTCVRDYVHVADLADAHLAAVALLKDMPRLVCNLGSSQGFSVRQVIAQVEQTTGRSVPVQVANRRLGDAAVLVASNQVARSVLQWEPARSSLEEIVASAWRWEQNRPR